MNFKVSIIIPTFNRADLISETLDSIVDQTYVNWECIIVDDDSTDNTPKIIESFTRKDARFKYHNRPLTKKKGANSCRNYGLDLSTGDFIQFFDSDDIMKPNCIENRVAQFLNAKADFLIFNMGFIKKGIKYEDSGFVTTVKTWEEALEKFLSSEKLPWNTIRIIFKSSSIKNKIYYNEDLLRFQDVEFNIRLLLNLKPNFKVVPVTDCYYRIIDVNNPKPPQFYKNVFESVPIYYKSLQTKLEPKQFNQNKDYFRQWIFNLTSLYTNKNVPFKLFHNAILSSIKYIDINVGQMLVLYLVFFLKKYFKGIKGHGKVYRWFKSIYN